MEFLTIDELMEVLRLPRSFIYCHTREKAPDRIPSYKVGKHLRFKRQDIEKWLERHRN